MLSMKKEAHRIYKKKIDRKTKILSVPQLFILSTLLYCILVVHNLLNGELIL